MNDTQSQVIAVCPECSAILRVNISKLGQHVRCSQCHHTFVAGEAVASAALRSQERQAPHNQSSDQVERIEAVCPGCKASLHVRRTYVGSNVRCKYCDEVFQVQDPAAVAGQTKPDPSATQPEDLQAERDRLYVAHNLLQAEHERLTSEHHELMRTKEGISAELEAKLKEHDDQLEAARAEHQELMRTIERVSAELEAKVREHDEQLEAARAEHQELVRTMERASAELEASVKEREAHLDRVRTERQAALDETERLRTALAEKDESSLRDRALFQREVEDLRREFDLAQEAHRGELAGLEAELAALQEDHRQHQNRYDSVQDLRDAEEQPSFAPAHSDAERWTEQVPVLRVVSETTEESAERSATATLSSASEGGDGTADVEDMGARIADLSRRLDESERLNKQMASVLGGMGIRCLPNRG